MSKKLILTQLTGTKFEELKPMIYPPMKHYANKVGADFYSIEDETMPECPVMEKLRLVKFMDDYDRIIFLDADLLIRSDCPDLFELVPEGSFGAYNEGASCTTAAELIDRVWHTLAIGQLFGLPAPTFDFNSLNYFNAGVMVFDKSHKEVFAIDKFTNPKGIVLCPEQSFINFNILRFKPKMFHLPVCFNQMSWNWPKNYQDCSYIVHYAGFPFEQRVLLMKGLIEYWGMNYGNF